MREWGKQVKIFIDRTADGICTYCYDQEDKDSACQDKEKEKDGCYDSLLFFVMPAEREDESSEEKQHTHHKPDCET